MKNKVKNSKNLQEISKENIEKNDLDWLKNRTKVVQKSTAQSNNLCDDSSSESASFEWSLITFQKLMRRSHELAFLFLFQYETGCRISEVLDISYGDILSDGSVKIQGKKGSEARIITAGRCASWLIKCKKARCSPFRNFNRFFVYREYVKAGITFQSENSERKSVTHALRQKKAEVIRNETKDKELISKALNHKNPKNEKFYGKKKK